MYDALVIGAGMIGSSAARHLSEAGLRVAVVGPAEPDNWSTHRGVFASHYDQGRITRIVDPDPVWSLLARRSIDAYADIAARSGIAFHQPSGVLHMVHAPSDREDRQNRRLQNGRHNGAKLRSVDTSDLSTALPMFHFPNGYVGVWEQGAAGYIHPRSLVQAQLALLQQSGGALVRQTALRIQETDTGMAVEIDTGETLHAQKVLVTTGAFSNLHELLLGQRLHIRPKSRTVALARVNPDQHPQLAKMPAVIMPVLHNSRLTAIYVLPPTQYPDGHWYIKLGGTKHPEHLLHEFADFTAWFGAEGSSQEAEDLQGALLDLVPDLPVEDFRRKACVLTYTEHGFPYIDTLAPGRLYVGVGGNGSAAKSSNEIGSLAAQLLKHDSWQDPELSAHTFRAVFSATEMSTDSAAARHGRSA